MPGCQLPRIFIPRTRVNKGKSSAAVVDLEGSQCRLEVWCTYTHPVSRRVTPVESARTLAGADVGRDLHDIVDVDSEFHCISSLVNHRRDRRWAPRPLRTSDASDAVRIVVKVKLRHRRRRWRSRRWRWRRWRRARFRETQFVTADVYQFSFAGRKQEQGTHPALSIVGEVADGHPSRIAVPLWCSALRTPISAPSGRRGSLLTASVVSGSPYPFRIGSGALSVGVHARYAYSTYGALGGAERSGAPPCISRSPGLAEVNMHRDRDHEEAPPQAGLR
jgi:hypothetical protein